MKEITGIYIILNKITRKYYVGQSVNIQRRFYQHKTKYKTKKTHLYNSMRYYGIDNFDFIVLYECNKEEMNKYETFYITVFNSFNDGYNETNGGDSNYIVSDELKIQISKRMKEYQNRPDVKENNSLSHIGKTSWKKNTQMSIDEKNKLSSTIKDRYENDPTYSDRVSETTKKAMNDPKVREKVKAGLTKLYLDDNYKKRLSDAHKGKVTKPIKCLYDNKVFNTREELRKYLNIPKTTLARYIRKGIISITLL